MSREFDLVVFDLGGVLVRATCSWQEAHVRARLPFPPPADRAFEERIATLPRRDVGAVDVERFYALWAEASQGVYSVDDARRINDASLIGGYPGIGRVFDLLDEAGVDTAVLSNTNASHWASLFPASPAGSKFPTLGRARHRFASFLLRVVKPDIRAYREVERATRHPADRILFFDDRPENTDAARSIGWTGELIDYTGDTAEQMLASLRRFGVVD